MCDVHGVVLQDHGEREIGKEREAVAVHEVQQGGDGGVDDVDLDVDVAAGGAEMAVGAQVQRGDDIGGGGGWVVDGGVGGRGRCNR